MLLNTAPQNEAIMSNVGEIGEFRIRNSAKAFNILSSGLYANKIKAIIRELSTNAYDSHAAAGKLGTPFDVHLPNSLEPWFSIRDYGTGLTHDQVTNIYTTYFESTKTNSNEFVGCLGLGSKSPFSYTENFTVTAIKDGRKGIYTAFINDAGVPSIARMTEEETDEPSGVEVRFAVEDYYDCRKFEQEAANVYRFFNLCPVISGAKIEIREVQFHDKDIVPGIHSMRDARQSLAIMGNIAYPIEVPNASTNLGSLEGLLHCGLLIEFNIGELDFQASREGLSYIPMTIKSIKDKLGALNDALAGRLTGEANKITCLWERSAWLLEKHRHSLWSSAVEKYVVDNKFPLIVNQPGTWEHMRYAKFKLYEDDLASKYNIVIRGFSKSRSSMGVNNLKAETERVAATATTVATNRSCWHITPSMDVIFVKNDTKVGATERARYHWRHKTSSNPAPYNEYVYVLDYADKTKPANYAQFLADLHNPPKHVFADTLLKREREQSSVGPKGESVSILKLCEDDSRYRTRWVWRDAGKAASFDSKSTYYYLPLSGYHVESQYGLNDVKDLKEQLVESGITELCNITIYGVRKMDIEFIKTQKNWVNLETKINTVLTSLTVQQKTALAYNRIDRPRYLQYNDKIVKHVTKQDSPFVKLCDAFKGIQANSFDERSLKQLFNRYAKDSKLDLDALAEVFNVQIKEVSMLYPLLSNLDYYRVDPSAVAHYVNLVDNQSQSQTKE